MYTQEVKIKRIRMEDQSIERDLVAKDVAFCIFVNGVPFKTLITSPDKVRELALGHIFTEGLIKNLDELISIDIEDNKADLELKERVNIVESRLLRNRLITTACASNEVVGFSNLKLGIDEKIDYKPDIILEAISILNKMGKVFLKTGGTHSALLINSNLSKFSHAEDVGRHNAVDKVIGRGLLNGFNFEEFILCTSGRLSSEMILKAARANVPVVCSISAPLVSGINLAESAGITLYGFVRGRRLNKYTGL
jgi:FdhD protein